MNSRYDEKTAEIIAGMLKENTGVAMLDSGGAYGRHWQQNQDRDFNSESESILSARWGLEITHNVYHFLCQALEYDPAFDSYFQDWREEEEDHPWGSGCEDFVTALKSMGYTLGGDYTSPDSPFFTVNTYNGEDLLSQTILYTFFEIDAGPYDDFDINQPEPGEFIAESGAYVILSIHGGCDVRGGYTDPKIFKVGEYPHITDNQRATLGCSECDALWWTDDAYHFYDDRNTRVTLADLKFYDSQDDTITAWYARQLYKLDGVIDYAKVEELTGESDLLIATDDHTVICPVCGRGHLIPSF